MPPRDRKPQAGSPLSPSAAADVSPTPGHYSSEKPSSLQPNDPSSLEPCGASSPTDRDCGWCRSRIPATAKPATVFCSRKCRQAAFRIRRRHQVEARDAQPMTMAYADPPYPGFAWMYANEPDFAGEVDHEKLVASLVEEYDGFALSTSAKTLHLVLPHFAALDREFRVCAWVKPIGVSGATRGLHNTWEPLIVVPGRELRPGKRDWLAAQPAKQGIAADQGLMGRKPEAFVVWMFELLGLLPGDTLVDVFPGSGLVGRAWAELQRSAACPS